jgi:hypothetical protein
VIKNFNSNEREIDLYGRASSITLATEGRELDTTKFKAMADYNEESDED